MVESPGAALNILSMTAYELTYVLVIVILVDRAFQNFLIFWRNRESDFLFYFAFAQVFFALYLVFVLKTMNVLEPADALIFERLENACVPIMSVFFLLFAQRFRPVFPDFALWGYAVVNVVLSLLILFYPHAYHLGLQSPKTFPVLGVTIYETTQPVWVIIVLTLDLFCIAGVMVRYMRKEMFERSESRFLALSLLIFALTAMNDMAVSVELWTLPYIAHFGFVVVIFAVENLYQVEVRLSGHVSKPELVVAPAGPAASRTAPKFDDSAGHSAARSEAVKTSPGPSAEKQVESDVLLAAFRAEPPADDELARASGADGRLFVRCLGALEIMAGNRVLPQTEIANKRKLLKLFKLLLVRYGKGIHREEALQALWPDLTEANALNNLHALTFRLRKIFQNPQALISLEDRLALDPAVVDTDFVRFEKLCDKGLALAQRKDPGARPLLIEAANLYRGDFFEFDPYFDGTDPIRNQLQQKYKKALLALCAISFQEKDHASLAEVASRAVQLDDLDEEAWRYYLRGLAASGRKNEALKKYEEFRRLLKKELDVEPDEETENVMRAVKG